MHIKKERRCVACRENKQQNEMLRIARLNDNYTIDKNHKLGGRGAYVCNDEKCIEKALKTGKLARTLKTKVSFEYNNRNYYKKRS